MSDAYVLLADLKSYKDISGSGDDTLLQSVLDAAHQVIDRMIGRVVLQTGDTTKYFDIGGAEMAGNTLHLADRGDICSITTVTNGDGVEITSGQYTTYPKTLTDLEPSIQRLVLLPASTVTFTSGSNDPQNALSVAGKWGMWPLAASVPESFYVSVLEVAAHILESRRSQVFDTVAVPDAGIIQTPRGLPATVIARLSGWMDIL